jgi:hypothetical protein
MTSATCAVAFAAACSVLGASASAMSLAGVAVLFVELLGLLLEQPATTLIW